MDALKAAQMHCLSMDLFSPEAVEDIFDVIIDWAFRNKIPLPDSGLLLCQT